MLYCSVGKQITSTFSVKFYTCAFSATLLVSFRKTKLSDSIPQKDSLQSRRSLNVTSRNPPKGAGTTNSELDSKLFTVAEITLKPKNVCEGG